MLRRGDVWRACAARSLPAAMALRFLTQQVVGTSFGIFTDAELRRLSVKRVSSAVSFDQFSHAAPDGLYDRALGPSGTDHTALCATCGLNAFECPGHPGHIELCVPVFHPLLFPTLYDLLRRKCFACHRFRAPAAASDALRAKLMLLDCGRLADAMALDAALAAGAAILAMSGGNRNVGQALGAGGLAALNSRANSQAAARDDMQAGYQMEQLQRQNAQARALKRDCGCVRRERLGGLGGR